MFEKEPGPIIEKEQDEKKEDYSAVNKKKNDLYEDLVDGAEGEQKMTRERIKGLLLIHENIVLQYGDELIAKHPNLSKEQQVATRLSLMLHDCGKIEAPVLEHHTQGSKNAEMILKEIQKEEQLIEGVAITAQLIGKVKEAIKRHMNHPFLVELNGQRFEEPKDDVDKIVFDSDMLANVGAKNVGYRLSNEKFMDQDKKVAEKTGVSQLEAAFDNVVSETKGLVNEVLTAPGKEKMVMLISAMNIVMQKLMQKDEQGENNLEKIQRHFSDNKGIFDLVTIAAKGGFNLIKEKINEEIVKAGKGMVEDKVLNNFKV